MPINERFCVIYARVMCQLGWPKVQTWESNLGKKSHPSFQMSRDCISAAACMILFTFCLHFLVVSFGLQLIFALNY